MSQMSFVRCTHRKSFTLVQFSLLNWMYQKHLSEAIYIEYIGKYDILLEGEDGIIHQWHVGSYILRYENASLKAKQEKRNYLPLELQHSSIECVHYTVDMVESIASYWDNLSFAKEKEEDSTTFYIWDKDGGIDTPIFSDKGDYLYAIDGNKAYWTNVA